VHKLFQNASNYRIKTDYGFQYRKHDIAQTTVHRPKGPRDCVKTSLVEVPILLPMICNNLCGCAMWHFDVSVCLDGAGITYKGIRK
jgi:hypothetical protein